MTLRRTLLAMALAAGAAAPFSPPGSRDTSRAPLPVPGLLWADGDQSPRAGAENLLFLADAAARLEDRLLDPVPFGNATWGRWAGSAAFRIARSVFIDQPLAYFLPLVQHEVYGHGYRAREGGYGGLGYELRPPPPYGDGGGSTSFSADRMSPDQALGMSMAGVEATDVLAQRTRARWVLRGEMRYHEALLYLSSGLGLQNYLLATDSAEADAGNDMLAYTGNRDAKARLLAEEPGHLGLSELEDESRVALLDPFFFLSAWGFATYLVTGDPRFRHPAIPLGPVRYLPSFGYRLTPWGGQYLFENLASWGGRGLNLRWAQGESDLGGYRGLDVETWGLASWRGYVLDATFRIWEQPALWLGDSRPGGGESWGRGGELAVTSPALLRVLPLRLALAAAGKSAGYVPGERLDAGYTLRVGVGLYR